MRAELKRIHSPDVKDLSQFSPPDPERFGILVQAMVGPEGENAEESFDVVVCTPAWLQGRLHRAPLSGRHYLFQLPYDYSLLWAFLAAYCQSCEGATWREAAGLVGRIGKWEFEDYKP
jgi:hypothetical protein